MFESVAFNPTVPAIIAALVALIVDGGSLPERYWARNVTDAVFAEEHRLGPSYADETAAVLHSVSPNATLRVVNIFNYS